MLPLGGERVTIGRAGANDLVLADDRVSRTHAAIHFEDEGYVIDDLDSSNGVRVDGQAVRTAVLRHGNRIGLGASVLQFSQPAPEVPEADRLALIDSSDVLKALDPTTKAAVAKRLAARFFPRRAVILRQGSPLRGIVFLYRGRARVVEVNDEGGEKVVARVEAGESFGERGLVAGGAALQSLVAEADACVLELDKGALDELLAKEPDVNRSHVDTLRVKLKTAQVKAASAGARRDDVDNIVTSADVEIIGEDKKILRAKDRIATLAKEGQPVLLVGPQGVGKRTFARHYHKVGPQPQLPYVELSAADAPQGVGAAIFGVESGQDVAGLKGQVGYLEMIGDGTLAIAHAELLDAHQQALLAAYLKLGWFHRVFGQQSVKTKTRLIFLATGEEADVLAKAHPRAARDPVPAHRRRASPHRSASRTSLCSPRTSSSAMRRRPAGARSASRARRPTASSRTAGPATSRSWRTSSSAPPSSPPPRRSSPATSSSWRRPKRSSTSSTCCATRRCAPSCATRACLPRSSGSISRWWRS